MPGLEVSKYYRIKWYVDVAVTVLTLPVIGSVILLFMFLTRLTSRGPVIYTQIRCSKNGIPFKMYKIRSMIADAESAGQAVWAGKHDPRITGIGKIMRKLHIDELPQIVNVWRGEMCVIGPRPERPEIVEQLRKEIPDYESRMQVLPGLTGFAQLNLPADSDLNDVQKKLILDLEYIHMASLGLDLRLLLGTAFKFIRINRRGWNTLPLRILRIYRNPEEYSKEELSKVSE